MKPQSKYGDLKYKNDPSRPGSGVFVVSGAKGREEEFKKLPPNTVVVKAGGQSGDEGDDTLGGAASSSEGGMGLGEENEPVEAKFRQERNVNNDRASPSAYMPLQSHTHTHTHSHSQRSQPQLHMQYSHTRTGAPTIVTPTSPASASTSASGPMNANRVLPSVSAARRLSAGSGIEGAPGSASRAQAAAASPTTMGPHTPTTAAALAAQQQQRQQPSPHQQQQQQHSHQQQQQQVGGYPGAGGASSSSNGSGGGVYPDLGYSNVNVNPALNNAAAASSGDVTVLNVLEANPPQNVLEQMQLVDSGLLAGIPGGMFDWREYLGYLVF